MPSDRAKLRGTILAEDRRTQRFFTELLVHLGFDKRKFTFRTAPKGKGDAKKWVRAPEQYPHEVRLLRQKNYQRLFLVAVRDGDNEGLVKRKIDLDSALRDDGLTPRREDERIATPVPTWCIETWLLALLGDTTIDENIETKDLKHIFKNRYPDEAVHQALRNAAQAWRDRADQISSVPSLADSKTEMSRLDIP